MTTNQDDNSAPLYAGIEAGGTKFNCVIGSDPLHVTARAKFPTTTPEETLAQTAAFFAEHSEKHGKFSAMGLACFGPVDLQKDSPTYGYITATPKKHWSNTDVAGYFEKALNIPVAFDTDVNGAAVGEHLYGAAQGIDDFVYVTIGTGVGAGVVANGKLVNGAVHTEMGHMFISRERESGPFENICPFHENCLTGVAAGPAIKARWGKVGNELPEDHEAWDLEAYYLAVMCVNITLCLSPRLIILGGGVMDQAHLFPKVRQQFKELMNGFMMPAIALEEYIVPTGLPGRSGEVGALALAEQCVAGQNDG